MEPSHNRIREVFSEALAKSNLGERDEYLEEACRGEPELRRQVAELLQAHEQEGTFLEITRGRFESDFTLDCTGMMIGRYKLLEKIGEGGFGVVYMAEQVEPVQRKVALKIIKAGMDTREVIARFEAERQALAMMDHPNIAKVFDAGTTQAGRPYVVIELVHGIPITEFCDRKNLSTMARLQLFIKVCHAVQHAHQKGIIHRDIKPNNVLVTLHDGEPVPKVIDFGIAKALGQKLTQKTLFTGFRHIMGTPAYMSPEQAEMNLSGMDIDTRADIYSLGVLLYELLTGVTPFDAETFRKAAWDEIRRIIREAEPLKPSTRLQTLGEKLQDVAKQRCTEPAALSRLVRGDLDWIVMKALEKERTRRYETANALAEDVAKHLRDDPVSAGPPSIVYKLRKTVRRHRLVTAFATTLLLILAAGIAVSTEQAVRARRFAREAENQRQVATNEAAQALIASQTAERAQRRAQASESEARHSLYVAQMRSVQDAWKNGDLPRMRELLDQTQNYPDRGFEWGFWQRQAECAEFHGDADVIESVLFAPAGDRVLGCGLVHSAYLWTWPEGRLLFNLRGKSLPDWVLPLPIAFSSEGNRIAIASSESAARVCDASTGKTLSMLRGHAGSITSLEFSPNGRWIATGGEDNTARIWDAFTGNGLLTLGSPTNRIEEMRSKGVLSQPQGVRITGMEAPGASTFEVVKSGDLFTPSTLDAYFVLVAFSPDSKALATASSDGTVTLWSPETGERLSTLQTGSVGNPTKLAFLQNGGQLLVARSGSSPSVWEMPSGKPAFHLDTSTQSIAKPVVSQDGRLILTANERTATIWDASTGASLRKFEDPSEKLLSLGISPDDQRVATVGRSVRVWDATSGKELAWFRGGAGPARAVSFSPDGKRLLTGDNHVVRVWRCPDTPNSVRWRLEARFKSAALSPTEDRLVVAQEQTIGVWDATAGKLMHALEGQGGIAVAFSPDGKQIAAGAADGSVRFWDVESGRQVGPLISHADVETVAFSRDGHRLLTMSATARAWDIQTAKLLMELPRQDTPLPMREQLPVIQFAEAPSRRVEERQRGPIYSRVSAGMEQSLPAWAWLRENKIAALSVAGHSMACSPDGRHIAIAGEDRSATAVLREAATGQEIMRFKGHSGEVLAVAFSPDGRRILTGSADRTARLWDATSGDELLILEGHEAGVSFVAFSSDGAKVVLGCSDGAFTVLDSRVSQN